MRPNCLSTATPSSRPRSSAIIPSTTLITVVLAEAERELADLITPPERPMQGVRRPCCLQWTYDLPHFLVVEGARSNFRTPRSAPRGRSRRSRKNKRRSSSSQAPIVPRRGRRDTVGRVDLPAKRRLSTVIREIDRRRQRASQPTQPSHPKIAGTASARARPIAVATRRCTPPRTA
jgi:hypothetical protein